MSAAELLVMLQALMEKGIPLHKVTIRIEVGDSYYDSDIDEESQISLTEYEKDGVKEKYLVFEGHR